MVTNIISGMQENQKKKNTLQESIYQRRMTSINENMIHLVDEKKIQETSLRYNHLN